MPTHSLYLTTNIPTTTPAIPNISCIGADTSIVMTFSANSDGGSPITSYQYSTDNFIADIHTISIDSSPYTINDLTDGTSYNIELRAVNKNGVGEKTNSPDITPGNIPSKPTITDISVGNASATITFTTPSDTGGSIINYYILTYSNDDFVNSTTISNITTNPFTIASGLTNGTTYKFKIRANNNFGDGVFSDVYTKAMPTTPSAPTINLITTPTNTTAIINFTAGDDGGLPITNYQYSIDGGTSFTAFSSAQTTTPITITTGLTPGQPYNIQLKAVNSINPGTASTSYPITMPNKVSATGGTELTNNGYKYHIFTTTGNNTMTFSQFGGTNAVEYLIVAAGGAGGQNHGGGGGAGEVVSGFTTISTTNYIISVGAGGLTSATNGGNSSAFSITCKGGGRGGGQTNGVASSGGSSGGGAGYNNGLDANGINISPDVTKLSNGAGYKGGNGFLTANAPKAGGGGGGGGSGSEGSTTSSSDGGNGGSGTNTYSVWINAIATTMNGIISNWSSKTISGGVGYIASGGGGGAWTATIGNGSIGGSGSGGNGTTTAIVGFTNTGSGGGGGGSGGQSGGSGGSGLVVVRYLV